MWKQKIRGKNVSPSENWTRASSDSKSNSPFWANWTFACKTETLGSLCSHVLLIPTKWSKSKNQARLAQKGECYTRNHRFIRSQGSSFTRGNILSLDFLFSHSKGSDVNIGIIGNIMCFGKSRLFAIIECNFWTRRSGFKDSNLIVFTIETSQFYILAFYS